MVPSAEYTALSNESLTFAGVKKVQDILVSVNYAPLERILGQQARILQRTPVSINSNIHAEHIAVSFDEGHWPEEHARLNLFPVADGQFCVQLLYLQYTTSGNADVVWIEFKPGFFDQYPLAVLIASRPFNLDKVTEQQFAICAQSTDLLEQLKLIKADEAFSSSLKQTETLLCLLRRALDCIALPFTVCPVPACRFLAYESEREKILAAQSIIEQNFDKPLTIKELSRKVAMNECYLKKGFKAMTGKTLYEYTQELRIAKAKELLQQKHHSVSDVANTLGFSSISHFSTAFKKATGMKPCELLG